MKNFLLLLPSLWLTPVASFTFVSTGRRVTARPALIYMPDGKVVVADDDAAPGDDDDDNDGWRASSQSETAPVTLAMLDYLNRPELCGPVAILAAANSHIMDLATIQHVNVKAITPCTVHIEALCASDNDSHCVNVIVSVDFPKGPCQIESEFIDNLGLLHQQAVLVLEERKKESEREDVDCLLSAVAADDDVLNIPSWWVPGGADFVDDCDFLLSIINAACFEQDLKDLVLRHQVLEESPSKDLVTLGTMERAFVVAIGQAGLIVEASGLHHTIKLVPIQFSFAAKDLGVLNDAVLDTLIGSNTGGHQEPKGGKVKTVQLDAVVDDDEILDDASEVEPREKAVLDEDTLED